MQQISVGKNVVRILNREFPIDSDLSMINAGYGNKAWRVDSIRQSHVFTPIVDDEVSAETFREYNVALGQSKAFAQRGKLRQLFDRKEEGVKVLPGHGVFILPSKMVVQQRGQRKIYIRVFGGTELARDFTNPDYKLMTLEAANYYFDNLRFLTDEINKNLWYPVKYNRNHQLLVDGLLIPDGVYVRAYDNGHVGVGYSSVDGGERNKWMGTAHNQSELDSLLQQADEIRRKEQQRAAMYRFVNPSYVPLSLYMRRV